MSRSYSESRPPNTVPVASACTCGQVPRWRGIAQRVIRGASLTTAVITVRAGEPFTSTLLGIYDRLGLALDPGTVGSIAGHHRGIDPLRVRQAIAEQAGEREAGDPSRP